MINKWGICMDLKSNINAEPLWAGNEMAFEVTKPGSLDFENLTKVTSGRGLQHQPATIIYDAMAIQYNHAKPGEMLTMSLPNRPISSNLRKTIEGRGLNENDYILNRPRHDKHGKPYPKGMRPFTLQRMTDKVMRTIQPSSTFAAQMAKEAEQRGPTFDFAQPEKLGIPGPADQFSAENQELANT